MRGISWNNIITVKVSRRGFEKFANECKDSGIILSDISQKNDFFVCSMTFSDFKKVRIPAKRSGVKIKIVKKKGALYFLHLHKKRYGFYFGAILSAVIFAYLTSCIWVIDIVGNETTSSQKILDVMSRNGIAPGAFRFGKKLSEIKNDALVELDTLSWLWVTLDGTRAIVEVREKGSSTDIIDKSKPVNLVASFPGVIEDMQIKSGRKVIERGMTVEEGQLLVSGITETQYRKNRYITSQGTVSARTWRTLEGEYHHIREKITKTGRTKKFYNIEFMGKTLNLYINRKSPFKEFVTDKTKNQVRLFKNFYLPLSFTTEEFCEIMIERESITDTMVVSEAVEALTEQIEKVRADDAVTLKRTYSYETLSNGNLKISVTLESLENIAKPVEIEVEDTEEITFG